VLESPPEPVGSGSSAITVIVIGSADAAISHSTGRASKVWVPGSNSNSKAPMGPVIVDPGISSTQTSTCMIGQGKHAPSSQ